MLGWLWGSSLLPTGACITGVDPHLCEVHEVFEACVQVRLLPKCAHVLEVRVVYVGVYAEETLENAVNDILKLGRKRFAIVLGKQVWIINLGRTRVSQSSP